MASLLWGRHSHPPLLASHKLREASLLVWKPLWLVCLRTTSTSAVPSSAGKLHDSWSRRLSSPTRTTAKVLGPSTCRCHQIMKAYIYIAAALVFNQHSHITPILWFPSGFLSQDTGTHLQGSTSDCFSTCSLWRGSKPRSHPPLINPPRPPCTPISTRAQELLIPVTPQ